MGGVMAELHPFVQHLAEKGYEGATIDEMAIVNTMRNCLVQCENNYHQLRYWLQQENPHKLRGEELSEWATEIAEWVLPTQMRRMQDATQTRKLTEGSQPEHQDGNQSREATEASSSDRSE